MRPLLLRLLLALALILGQTAALAHALSHAEAGAGIESLGKAGKAANGPCDLCLGCAAAGALAGPARPATTTAPLRCDRATVATAPRLHTTAEAPPFSSRAPPSS